MSFYLCVSFSLYMLNYSSWFKLIECEQGILVPSFELKLVARTVFTFLILGVPRSQGFWNKHKQPNTLRSAEACELSQGTTLVLQSLNRQTEKGSGNTPLWPLHPQLLFSDIKRSLIKPQLHNGWQMVERKSHCPPENDINPSSLFPQLLPKFWPVKRLLTPKKAVTAHSQPTAEAVIGQFWSLLFSLVIGDERSWPWVSMKNLVLLVSLPVFTPPTPSEISILLSHNPTNPSRSREIII